RAVSMAAISAWAWGERRIAAWSVPGGTPRSSMKRPRPVKSAASSTRGSERPIQGAPSMRSARHAGAARAQAREDDGVLPARVMALDIAQLALFAPERARCRDHAEVSRSLNFARPPLRAGG